jgi:hypothetical protein
MLLWPHRGKEFFAQEESSILKSLFEKFKRSSRVVGNMAVHACNPSSPRGIGRRIEADLGKKHKTLSDK